MRLLIIRPAALGDTLMLMPSLHALRQKAETILVGRSPGINFLAPHVRRVMNYETHGWHALFTDEKGTAPSLLLHPADLALLFHGDPDGRVAARLRTLLPCARVKVFPGFPPAEKETHVALYLARCLQASGCPIEAERAFKEALRFPLLSLWNIGEGFTLSPPVKATGRAVFHPGSGGKTKNHPPRFWLKLIDCFGASFPFPLALLLGPAEEELLSFFRDRLQKSETEILFCPEKETLMPLLAQSRLFAGHDSGITHLAAMLGAPTLAFFRSTSVVQWRPLGPKVRIIEGDHCGPDVLEKALAQAEDLLK